MEEEVGAKVKIEYREVDRPVVVLSGEWTMATTEGKVPKVEIYGRDMNRDMHIGGVDRGDGKEFAGWLSNWIGEQTLMEGTHMPKELQWHQNTQGDGSQESRGLAQDKRLVLKHVEEQTGLKAVEEVRRARRLFVEREKTP
jgi:hypothetical protein